MCSSRRREQGVLDLEVERFLVKSSEIWHFDPTIRHLMKFYSLLLILVGVDLGPGPGLAPRTLNTSL